jgi:L-2,4-diaminobutyrate transaminase
VAGRVAKEAFARGVIGRALPQTDTLAFSPAFVISEEEIDTVVKTFREATDVVAQELVDEGVWRPGA